VEKLKQFNLHDVSSLKQKEAEGISQLVGATRSLQKQIANENHSNQKIELWSY
jgi:hypothetical protein